MYFLYRYMWACALGLASLFSYQAQAQVQEGVICDAPMDRYFKVDGDLQLALTLCDGHKINATVLFIPGWTGDLEGVGDVFKDMAHDLAKQGIVSVRTNIRGESEREASGFTLTSTYASRVYDAQLALNYLVDKYSGLPLALIGHSLGGATAITLAGNSENKIDNLVLWSSSDNPSTLFPKLLTEQQHREVMEKGKVVYKTWADIVITKKHYLGMVSPDMYLGLENFKGDLLYLVGSEEASLANETRLFNNVTSTRKEKVLVLGADHIYNVFDQASTHSNRVRKITQNWLNDTLL